MKFGWALFGLAAAQGGNKKPFNADKKFAHLEKVHTEVLNNFFVDSEAASKSPAALNQKKADQRDEMVKRFGNKYQYMLDQFEILWKRCGNKAVLDSRSTRFDKTNWRKAFNQMRNGYTKLIDNELGTCTENEDARLINRLREKVNRWAHNLGYQYCKKIDPEDVGCHKRRPNYQLKQCGRPGCNN